MRSRGSYWRHTLSVLIPAEREHTVFVLAEIKEDVTGSGRTRSPPHGYNRAERRAWESNEIRVAFETARHRRPRAAYTNRLETSVDKDGAPGIADSPTSRQGDERLNSAVLPAFLKPEIACGLSQPRRMSFTRRGRPLRRRGLLRVRALVLRSASAWRTKWLSREWMRRSRGSISGALTMSVQGACRQWERPSPH